MKVKNYYLMPEDQLDDYLGKIRDWLFNYPDEHPNYEKVRFALRIAYCAKHLERDPFVEMVIKCLT